VIASRKALEFFTTGEAWKSSGEEGFPGNYELDGHIAKGKLFGRPYTFDFTTNLATGDLIAGSWLADTKSLISIACL